MKVFQLKRIHRALLVPILERLYDPSPRLDILFSEVLFIILRDELECQEFLNKKNSEGETMRQILHKEYTERICYDGPGSLVGVLAQIGAVFTHHLSSDRLKKLKESSKSNFP